MRITIKKMGKGTLKLPSSNAMLKIGLMAINTIRRRTTIEKRGLNGTFKKYSKEYSEYKSKIRPGYSGVDLQLTGKMFANLKVITYNTMRVIIGFTGVNAVKAAYNNKIRPFFGLKLEELRKILKKI